MSFTDPAETPKIIDVAEGFHVRQAIDNIAWIDLGDYAIVVDALEQPELEDEIFEAIDLTLGNKPIRYLLNTHTHYDHIALNDAFHTRHNTEVVNQRTSSIPAEGRWFEGPQRRVLMLPLPGCHTNEDCIVWAPEDCALFTGDIFGWGLIPLTRNLNAETAELLLNTYARLIGFDAVTVIPGHGPLCTTAELKHWVEYFHWLKETVANSCTKGMSDDEIRSAITPSEDMAGWWRFLQWKHADSIDKMLKAIRKGWL